MTKLFSFKTDVDKYLANFSTSSDYSLLSSKNLIDLKVYLNSELDLEVVDIQFHKNQGTLNSIYLVLTSDSKKYVLKVKKFYSLKQHLDPLFFLHNIISKKVIRTPDFLICNYNRDIIPFDFTLIEFVPGQPLDSLDISNQDLAYTRLGETISRLHEITGEGYGLISSNLNLPLIQGSCSTWEDYFNLNLEEHLQTCYVQGLIDSKLCDRLKQTIKNWDFILRCPFTPCLLHGDLNDQNVFLDQQTLYIIDWEDALLGDPIFDLALWGTFINHQDKLNLFLRGYKLSAIDQPDFMNAYWLYYLRIIISKTALRYKLGYTKSDKIQPFERLKPALEHLEETKFK